MIGVSPGRCDHR